METGHSTKKMNTALWGRSLWSCSIGRHGAWEPCGWAISHQQKRGHQQKRWTRCSCELGDTAWVRSRVEARNVARATSCGRRQGELQVWHCPRLHSMQFFLAWFNLNLGLFNWASLSCLNSSSKSVNLDRRFQNRLGLKLVSEMRAVSGGLCSLWLCRWLNSSHLLPWVLGW